MNKIHFISGLPRSGSTLLAAILNQNPRFSASFRSSIEDEISRKIRVASGEFLPSMKDRMIDECKALFNERYKDTEVAFDTNRAWMLRDSLLKQLYPDYKMILCVRDIVEILNSFEKLHKRNPFILTGMYDEARGANVFTRTATLLSEGGIVMEPYMALQQYLAAAENEPLIVEYKDLAGNPKGTMKRIYKYLGEEDFQHDFENIEQVSGAIEYDMNMRTPGLHSVRKEVYLEEGRMLLPDTLVDRVNKQMPNAEFWRNGK